MRKEMGRKNDTFRFWLFLALAVGCSCIGLGSFFTSSPIKDKLFCPAGRAMLGETLVFFLWQYFFFCMPENVRKKIGREKIYPEKLYQEKAKEKLYQKKKGEADFCRRKLIGVQAAGIGLGLGVGLWCHQILLPFLVSGCWLLGLLLLGDFLFRRWKSGKESWYLRLAADFIMGSGAWITLICFLSAFGIGGLDRIRVIAALLVMAVVFETVAELGRQRKKAKTAEKEQQKFRAERKNFGKKEGLFCAVMLTMVFVQLARINLMPDYDSLHYGLRSPYILDGGRGIYENLGNINLVYTYPKGWEILTFPLSGTVTYGYQLCFNLWMAVMVLVLASVLVFWLSGKRGAGMFCGMLVSLIPGVMNMGITAKSDLLTLVCQMFILWGAVGICKSPGKRDKICWFSISLGACLLSFSMKPTALVFSSVLSVSCLGALLFCGGFSADKADKFKAGKKEQEKLHRNILFPFLAPVIPGAGAWVGTWIRTWKMTGVPTTSVFTSVWEKLGFSVKWPYVFSAIPNQGLEMDAGESAVFLLKRLLGVLFVPAGEDMFHVRLAWGSSVIVLGLAAWLLWGVGKGKEKTCLKAAAGSVGLFSLFSLYLLWQVDGNYYMLLYVLFAVIGSLSLENALTVSAQNRRNIFVCPWAASAVFALFVLIQAELVLGTNWAGTTGFTPVKFLHSGIVNHQQQRYQEKCETGNQEIWAILSQNPRTRVIAVGEHPQVLQFPCNVQSYYDVTGSGGNVRLVKTLEDFKQFLRFAQIEYIYVEAGYLEEGSRAYDVVRYLVEEGSLADLRFAYGNMVGRVNLNGEIPADPEKEADNFYRQIEIKASES